jgi:lipid-A-disaccharide synthase
MGQTHPHTSLIPVDLFLFAGEASGDRLGAELLTALLDCHPHLSISAVAGPAMRVHPISVFLRMEEFQVMGFVDVFQSLPHLIRLFKKIKRYLLTCSPKAIVFIDYPGFNLRMAKHLRKAGFRGSLIHYVCPSVWAWKKNRIYSMSRDLDLLISLFPFEKNCFASTSLPVQYIGHPLAETIDLYQAKPLDLKTPIFSIFPGSRMKEIERNLPLQLKAAVELAAHEYSVAISCAHPDLLPLIQKEVAQYPAHLIHIIPGEHNYDLMHISSIAFATSGTITLELALHQVPTLVTYAMSAFDFFLAHYLLRIRLPHYCIANYTAGARIFPEFYGPYFNQTLIYETLSHWLSAPEKLKECQKKCLQMQKLVYRPRPSHTAAQHILDHINPS